MDISKLKYFILAGLLLSIAQSHAMEPEEPGATEGGARGAAASPVGMPSDVKLKPVTQITFQDQDLENGGIGEVEIRNALSRTPGMVNLSLKGCTVGAVTLGTIQDAINPPAVSGRPSAALQMLDLSHTSGLRDGFSALEPLLQKSLLTTVTVTGSDLTPQQIEELRNNQYGVQIIAN